jgi:probable HAF family extracellular repeat protein
MMDLGQLPTSAGSFGYGINGYGQVVGDSNTSGGHRGFLWTPAAPNSAVGSMVNLGELPGGIEESVAFGINASGQVTGRTNTFAGDRAFVWTPAMPRGVSGTMVDLGSAGSSGGFGINMAGQIAGRAAIASGNAAFVWTPTVANGESGVVTSIGRLAGGSYSLGNAINDVGQIVGFSDASGVGSRAILWTPSMPNGNVGAMISLGDLPGRLETSVAYDVNNAGQVVGGADGEQTAFRWTAQDGMVNLNAELDASGAAWRLFTAYGINNAGQIVGIGSYDPDGAGPTPGVLHGFLLTPVPEPGGIFLSSLFLPMFLRRRQRHFR